MVHKKAQEKHKVIGHKKAIKAKMRKSLGKDTPAAKWRRMAGLTAEALAALKAGDVEEVRGYLEAIRAVALCAAEAESAGAHRSP